MNRQVSLSWLCKYANVKLCARSVVSRLAGRTGPREIKTDEPRNHPPVTAAPVSEHPSSQLTYDCFFLVQWWAWETKKRGGRLYVMGLWSQGLNRKVFTWLWLNKYSCLAVPAYHTRNCVIKCLQTKTLKHVPVVFTLAIIDQIWRLLLLTHFINQSIFLQRFYEKYYVGN